MENTEENIIEIRGLKTYFGAECIHDGLNLEVRRGEILALVGGSGSGKSTLLREIIMLTRPAAGSVRVCGEDIVNIDERRAEGLRRRFGVMFQQGALFSALTVAENVAVPIHEHTRLPNRLICELAKLKVALAGLPAAAGAQYPRQLSGGMLKRAAVARALALDPELLFLDEPSAGLDPVSANALDELILQLRDSLGLTVVMVTHDLDSLWRITDRVAFLGEKKVIGLGALPQLTESPHALIQAYFQGPRGRMAQEHAWTPE